MSLISFIIVLALAGLVTWAVVTYIPMPDGIKKVIVIVAIVAIVIFALQTFGLIGSLDTVRVPHVAT